MNADVLGTESTASAGLGLLVVSIATVLNSGR
jgi:hypothetical protein